jgi:hypothetical protein
LLRTSCIPDLDEIDFDLICHKRDKSEKGEYSICTLQTNYTRQHRLFINYVNINDAYHLEIWQLYYYQTIVIYWYNIVKLYIDTRITTLLRTRTHVDKLTI